MIRYALEYTFLASIMAALVQVIDTPFIYMAVGWRRRPAVAGKVQK